MSSSAVDSSQPLVSVVIPAFNAAKTLRHTLDSIRAQTYTNIEIVVVNDGSTDDTAAVLREYAASVRTITQRNGGLAKARNAGCSAARGELIALMDADDLCMPERVAVQVGVMQALPATVLCTSDFAAFNKNGFVSHSHGARYYSMIGDAPAGLSSLYPERRTVDVADEAALRVEVHHGDVYRELVHGNFVHPPTIMFRRSALIRVGLFDETVRYNCDWEWIVRMARYGSFAHVVRPLLDYRLSETQMSSQSNHGEGAFDIVRAGEKIARLDPNLMIADRARMRRTLGKFCLEAADALAERQKIKAARTLFSSVWVYGMVKPFTLKVAAKILLPLQLRQWLQRLRVQNRAYSFLLAIPENLEDIALSCVDSFAPLITVAEWCA